MFRSSDLATQFVWDSVCCERSVVVFFFDSSGVNLIVGTESGLYLLDRSGYGKGKLFLVYHIRHGVHSDQHVCSPSHDV